MALGVLGQCVGIYPQLIALKYYHVPLLPVAMQGSRKLYFIVQYALNFPFVMFLIA